jgi:hypothetical protein
MRLAYLEDPETWKRVAEELDKLAKEVHVLIDKSNNRFSKPKKIVLSRSIPRVVLYHKPTRKVFFLIIKKFSFIAKNLGDNAADDYRRYRRNHSCPKIDD